MSIFRMLADAVMIALVLNVTILTLWFSALLSSIILQNYGGELFSLGVFGELAVRCIKFGPPIVVFGTAFYFARKVDRKMEQAERRIARKVAGRFRISRFTLGFLTIPHSNLKI